MGKTISEKILSKAAGRSLQSGDVVWAKVSTVSMIDKPGFAFLERHNLKVWDPQRILFSFDHFMYPHEGTGVIGLPKIRSWAKKQGIPAENVFDIGRHGISHQVPAEAGKVLPGTVYVGGDTQASTMGAFNCFALACVNTAEYVMASGDVWVRVPESIRIHLNGTLPKGVLGKDIYLRLLKDLEGECEGRAIEFSGPGIASLPIDVRMAVANGGTHLGAATLVFPADQRLLDYLHGRAAESFETVAPDDDAHYLQTYTYDLSSFEPIVAGPDDPSLIAPLSAFKGVPIQAGYIGSCSSGRLADLTLAAEVLKGKHIHPSVRLVVTPISSLVAQDAAEQGLLAIFAKAGATITTPGCGACFYGNQSPLLLDEGETCITSSVENWPGRMGSDKAHIYLGNAAAVAASALEGCIADPRDYFADATRKG